MIKGILILILALGLIIGGFIYYSGSDVDVNVDVSVNDELEYTDVSAQEAKTLIDSNPDMIVIDVSPHYNEGHLPGAVNYYPISELEDDIANLDESATYLVYCHVDSASRAGAQKLVDAGFENVYRLESHYSGWVDAGYEVEM